MDLKTIETKLVKSNSNYLSGLAPSAEDNNTFNALLENNIVPNAASNPHAFSWYASVSLFSQSARDSWSNDQKAPTSNQGGADKDAKKAAKEEKKAGKDAGKNAKADAKAARLAARQA